MNVEYRSIAMSCGRRVVDYDLFAMPRGFDRRHAMMYIERMCEDGALLDSGPNRCVVPVGNDVLLGRASMIPNTRDSRGRDVYECVGVLIPARELAEVHRKGLFARLFAVVEIAWDRIRSEVVIPYFTKDERGAIVTETAILVLDDAALESPSLQGATIRCDLSHCIVVPAEGAWALIQRALSSLDSFDAVRTKAVERVSAASHCQRLRLQIAGVLNQKEPSQVSFHDNPVSSSPIPPEKAEAAGSPSGFAKEIIERQKGRTFGEGWDQRARRDRGDCENKDDKLTEESVDANVDTGGTDEAKPKQFRLGYICDRVWRFLSKVWSSSK